MPLKPGGSLGYRCVTFDHDAAFVIKVSLKYVGVVPLVYLACGGIGRKSNGRGFVVRSPFVAPGAGVPSFGMCHNFSFFVFMS